MKRHLEELEGNGLVLREKPANWRRGQKIHFSLTQRGEKRALEYVVDNIRKAFEKGLGLVRHLDESGKTLSRIERAINPVELGEAIVEFDSPPREFDSKTLFKRVDRQICLREQNKKLRLLLQETLKVVYGGYFRLRPLPYEMLENDALMEGYKSFLESVSMPHQAFGDRGCALYNQRRKRLHCTH